MIHGGFGLVAFIARPIATTGRFHAFKGGPIDAIGTDGRIV